MIFKRVGYITFQFYTFSWRLIQKKMTTSCEVTLVFVAALLFMTRTVNSQYSYQSTYGQSVYSSYSTGQMMALGPQSDISIFIIPSNGIYSHEPHNTLFTRRQQLYTWKKSSLKFSKQTFHFKTIFLNSWKINETKLNGSHLQLNTFRLILFPLFLSTFENDARGGETNSVISKMYPTVYWAKHVIKWFLISHLIICAGRGYRPCIGQ